eukprot:1157757-Pelagomonas_calceolata.AAC.21
MRLCKPEAAFGPCNTTRHFQATSPTTKHLPSQAWLQLRLGLPVTRRRHSLITTIHKACADNEQALFPASLTTMIHKACVDKEQALFPVSRTARARKVRSMAHAGRLHIQGVHKAKDPSTG